jgi:hypothetical protein
MLGVGEGYESNPFRIPFVDFARGDGLVIGPGGQKSWMPNVIDEGTPWVSEYRGLWGLYARDPISGENAPAGPMYNRDGTPRGSWYDPLGFSGLDKVPPPPFEIPLAELRCAELEARQTEIIAELEPKTQQLQELGLQLRSMQGNPFLQIAYDNLQLEVNRLSETVKTLRREQSENQAQLETLARRLQKLRAGIPDDPRAHIVHLGKPVSTSQMRFNRLAETWAAISISALLLGIAAIIVFEPRLLVAGAFVMIVAFILIEAVLRGTYTRTVNTMAVILAVVASAILIFYYWQWILVAALIAAAVFLLVQKLRELRE